MATKIGPMLYTITQSNQLLKYHTIKQIALLFREDSVYVESTPPQVGHFILWVLLNSLAKIH